MTDLTELQQLPIAPSGAVLRYPDGRVYERQGEKWVALHLLCDSVTARWCPVHGDCTCPEDGDLDDEACPLHSPDSLHAATVLDLAESDS